VSRVADVARAVVQARVIESDGVVAAHVAAQARAQKLAQARTRPQPSQRDGQGARSRRAEGENGKLLALMLSSIYIFPLHSRRTASV